jgi:hypothetical protein
MQDKDSAHASFPIDLEVSDGKYYVVLAKIPRTNLDDPFFIDSLTQRFNIAEVNKTTEAEQKVLVRPLHYNRNDDRIELIPLETFVNTFYDQNIDPVQTNFIFHMSRCGSTLAMQMLATCERFYVISESTMINAVLNPAMTLPKGIAKTQLLKAVINSIYRCRPNHCERVFIKFRSWNTLFIGDILNSFPNVHWMFTHRNGLEVLESVLRDPPGWMRSRHTHTTFFSEVLGLSETELASLSDAEHACRLLGVFCENAGIHQGINSLYIDYLQIPTELPSILNAKWGLALSDKEIRAMIERTKLYSKDPKKTQVFEADSEKKRQSINEQDRQYAETFVESQRRKLK